MTNTEDMVNSPKHYTGYSMVVEPIIICKELSFCIGNAVKYIVRAGLKGAPEKELEDFKKAGYYIAAGAEDSVPEAAVQAFDIVKKAFPEDKRRVIELLLNEDTMDAYVKVNKKIKELENKFNESK